MKKFFKEFKVFISRGNHGADKPDFAAAYKLVACGYRRGAGSCRNRA